jgi:hypothetical protein
MEYGLWSSAKRTQCTVVGEGEVAARTTTTGQGIEAKQSARNNQNNQTENTGALSRAAGYH